LLAFSINLAALCSSAHAVGQSLRTEEILKAFEEQVLLQVPGIPEKILVKWQAPIRVGIISTDGLSPEIFSDLGVDLVRIDQATNHPMTIATENVNFLVVISRDPEGDLRVFNDAQIKQFFPLDSQYRSFLSQYHQEKFGCEGKFLMSASNVIVAYLTFVSVSEDREMVEACLLRQLMKGMGAVNRSTVGQQSSVLKESDREFTDIDSAVLKLLYDAKILSGMGESRSMSVARQALEGK
jgi:hypothetical protein